MANKYKKVTINVSNDELNALEDYLNVDFEGDKEKEEKMRKKALRIYIRLVSEFDK